MTLSTISTTKKLSDCKIRVTNHAVERLKERFRYKFFNYLHNRQMIENLIIAQVMNGSELFEWKQSPFYDNMMKAKYGKNMTVVTKSSVFYVGFWDELHESLTIVTCVPRFLFYNKNDKKVIDKNIQFGKMMM